MKKFLALKLFTFSAVQLEIFNGLKCVPSSKDTEVLTQVYVNIILFKNKIFVHVRVKIRSLE